MKWIPRVVALLLLVFSINGFFGMLHRYFELACNFRIQYFFLAVLLAAIFVFLRDWKFLTVAIVCFVVNAIVILPYYFAAKESPDHSKGKELRVLSFNVFFRNRDYSPILNFIRTTNAGVVMIQEATPLWMKQFRSLRNQYPHIRFQSNRNNFGLAVLSQFPLKIFESSNFTVPYLMVQINVKGHPISVINTHLLTPTDPWRFKNRNLELHELGPIVRKSEGGVIVAGDFNMTIWSPYYAAFVRANHLKDARIGFGVVPTFPTNCVLVMIPIDHFLVSSNMRILNLNTGPDIGSDHLPLVLDVEFLPN